MSGHDLPRIVAPPPGPRSRELATRLQAVESRNVTYLAPDFPVFWSRASGSMVEDADGNRFLDLTGAFGVAIAGHGHPRIVAAIRAQAELLVHGMGDVHPPTRKVELLERICALAPWKEARAVLGSTGSEAVEVALKTARLATGRRAVVAFDGGYHGLTLGSLAVTSREDFRSPFGDKLARPVEFVPFPGSGVDRPVSERSLAALDTALARLESEGTPAGCVIVEPIQGRGGVRVPPPGFLAAVAERARKAGALFVLDEIFTGLGRTGSYFVCVEEGIAPDLLCVGKSLGGGLPLSACVGPKEVMDAWPASTGEALHTSTFLGHPLACAASLSLLDVLEAERLVERARTEGIWLSGELRRALAGSDKVVEVRGRGLFLGIELATARGASENSVVAPGAEVATRALAKGLILLPAGSRGEVVELAPPLTTSRTQLEWAVETLADVIG